MCTHVQHTNNSNAFWEINGAYRNGIPKHVDDHFNSLLYTPNYTFLHLVLENYERYKNLVFLDNGAGYGLLAIFLDKIKIRCYSYDNFIQHESKGSRVQSFVDTVNLVYKSNTFDVFPHVFGDTKSIYEIDNIDAATSMGIWLDNPNILFNSNVKYFFLDTCSRSLNGWTREPENIFMGKNNILHSTQWHNKIK